MNPCIIPVIKQDQEGDGRWLSMHTRYVQEAKSSEPEIVFIGDSIIQQLKFSSLWNEDLASLHCVNFGIGGDRVEHVLWRIQNGELDFHNKIKAVVLFVGTNNVDCSPQDIFEGIVEIVREIKQQLGDDVHVILPTLLPRGQHPNPCRDRNHNVNKLLIEKFGNDVIDSTFSNVHVVKIHDNIVYGDQQTISHHIMHDYLHLTNYGYSKIFGPVYDLVTDLFM